MGAHIPTMRRLQRVAPLFPSAPKSFSRSSSLWSASVLSSRNSVPVSSPSFTLPSPFARGYATGALSRDDITNRVLTAVKNFHKTDESKVNVSSHFTNDLGLDSLDTVELVLSLEDEFCIEIPEDDADKLQTCEQAIDYILSTPGAK